MTRQIKKSILASAVAASLGAAGAAWGHSDDSILFPYVVKSSSVTTLLTIINRGRDEDLHLTYLYKTPGTVTSEKDQNNLNCKHFDSNIPSSKNDIITFDVGRKFGDERFVLFNDPGAGPDHPDYDGYTPSVIIEDTWIGQLIVDSDIELLPGEDLEAYRKGRDRLFGEAMIFEYGSGAMWGYLAYNSTKEDVFNFSARGARNGEVLTEWSPPVPIDVVPLAESVQLVERLYVTPIGHSYCDEKPLLGGLEESCQGQRKWYSQNNDGKAEQRLSVNLGLGKEFDAGDLWYNRNEVARSEPVDTNIVCVGRVTIKDYVSNSLKYFLADGGWTDVVVSEGKPAVARAGAPELVPVDPVSQAIVQKLEYNTGNDYFPGATGIWNTAVWLRDMKAEDRD